MKVLLRGCRGGGEEWGSHYKWRANDIITAYYINPFYINQKLPFPLLRNLFLLAFIFLLTIFYCSTYIPFS